MLRVIFDTVRSRICMRLILLALLRRRPAAAMRGVATRVERRVPSIK